MCPAPALVTLPISFHFPLFLVVETVKLRDPEEMRKDVGTQQAAGTTAEPSTLTVLRLYSPRGRPLLSPIPFTSPGTLGSQLPRTASPSPPQASGHRLSTPPASLRSHSLIILGAQLQGSLFTQTFETKNARTFRQKV